MITLFKMSGDFNIVYSVWSGSRDSDCKPFHSHFCSLVTGHIDLLATSPICYMYCVFALALLSAWNLQSQTQVSGISSLCTNATFSERLSLTTYIKCLSNPPPFHLCIHLLCSFFFIGLITYIILYYIFDCLFIICPSHQNVTKTLSLTRFLSDSSEPN